MSHTAERSEVKDCTPRDGLALVAPLAVSTGWLVAVAVGVGFAGYGGSFLVAPTFSASTTFISPAVPRTTLPRDSKSISAGDVFAVAGLTGKTDQYVGLMKSALVADRLIDRFSLMADYGIANREDVRNELALRTQVDVGPNNSLVTVSVEDSNPSRAAAIANQYVAELRRLVAQFAVTEAQQRRAFFEKLLEQTAVDLENAKRALRMSGFDATAMNAGAASAATAYANARAQLAAEHVHLQAMKAVLGETNPTVRQQQIVIGALNEQLERLEHGEPQIANGADYIGKYREFKYQETLFYLLQRQYDSARTDAAREGATVAVVDAAHPPEHRARPRRAMVALGAALVAWFGGVAVLLLRNRWQASGARARMMRPDARGH